MKTFEKKERISLLLPSQLVRQIKEKAVLEERTQTSVIEEVLKKWSDEKFEEDLKELAKIDFSGEIGTEEEWMNIAEEALKGYE